jgi:hypothetical protein
MEQQPISTPPRPTIPASTNAPSRQILNSVPITNNVIVSRVLFK